MLIDIANTTPASRRSAYRQLRAAMRDLRLYRVGILTGEGGASEYVVRKTKEDPMTKLVRELQDQRGITGLETAIVLIAFVVVASVFAFAVLSTGLLSSEKAKTTVAAGLAQGGVAIVVKGSIIAHESSTNVGRLQVPLVLATDESVDLSSASLVVTYIDSGQVVDLTFAANAKDEGPLNYGWSTEFSKGTGAVMNPGERADFWINLEGLPTPLGTNKQFTVQIKPEVGSVLEITRTTPGEVTAITNLN
jgi:flagellin FlaB